jgi:hypothetical protein
VSEDDILRAIAKLGVLGGGFAVVRVGDRRMVRPAASDKHAVECWDGSRLAGLQ